MSQLEIITKFLPAVLLEGGIVVESCLNIHFGLKILLEVVFVRMGSISL